MWFNNARIYCKITLKIMEMLENMCQNWVRILEEKNWHSVAKFPNLGQEKKNPHTDFDKLMHPKLGAVWCGFWVILFRKGAKSGRCVIEPLVHKNQKKKKNGFNSSWLFDKLHPMFINKCPLYPRKCDFFLETLYVRYFLNINPVEGPQNIS